MKTLLISAAFLLLAAAQPAAAQTDWTACADEGSWCRVKGQALVRFGVPGRYVFRVVQNRVMCDTEEFGDPAQNQVKQCQVSYRWRDDERYRDWRDAGQSSADRWRQCANEGETCRVAGPARVRYGSGGRFAYRNTSDSIACNNASFGDPAPDIAKQCEYFVEAGTGGGGGAPQWGDKTSLVWDLCAIEGRQCNVKGSAMLRYGTAGRYYYREAARGLVCSNENFGGDPVPDKPKRCETLRLTR